MVCLGGLFQKKWFLKLLLSLFSRTIPLHSMRLWSYLHPAPSTLFISRFLFIMSHFDESSGIVPCSTPWGHWYQTVEEVCVLVNCPPGTKAKSLDIKLKSDSVSGKLVFASQLRHHYGTITLSNISIRIFLFRNVICIWCSLLSVPEQVRHFRWQVES